MYILRYRILQQVVQLPGPCLQSKGSPSVASTITDAATLHPESSSVGNSRSRSVPPPRGHHANMSATLPAFVTMRKLNLYVLQRKLVVRQLFQTEDDIVVGCIDPQPFRHEGHTRCLKLWVIEYSSGVPQCYFVSSIKNRLGGCRSEGRTVLGKSTSDLKCNYI
jgi:hypothetical protein